MMKNVIKTNLLEYFRIYLIIVLLLPVSASLSATQIEPKIPAPASLLMNIDPQVTTGSCGAPNVTKTGQGSGSASFSWSGVDGALEYKVWYVRHEDSHISSVINTSNNYITLSGLSSGTYDVYFATVCDGGTSGYVIIEDVVIF